MLYYYHIHLGFPLKISILILSYWERLDLRENKVYKAYKVKLARGAKRVIKVSRVTQGHRDQKVIQEHKAQ